MWYLHSGGTSASFGDSLPTTHTLSLSSFLVPILRPLPSPCRYFVLLLAPSPLPPLPALFFSLSMFVCRCVSRRRISLNLFLTSLSCSSRALSFSSISHGSADVCCALALSFRCRVRFFGVDDTGRLSPLVFPLPLSLCSLSSQSATYYCEGARLGQGMPTGSSSALFVLDSSSSPYAGR